MAQTIKLKRTAVQGKIPTTSNLDLGELAINTYDGRIFFEKDVDGTLSIQEILTTDSDVTGSLNLNGAITASYINANGSGNSILVSDTLRIAENGSGLRMTNVGAFDNSSGDFRIFSNQDLILATNGENGTAVTIDQTTKDANFVGAITASSLQITGNTIIDGNLTLGGNITIGDSTTDSITVSADFSSSLIPDSGSTYDLGSSSKPWNEVHANTLYGDGSNITNITVDAAATVSSTFTNSSSVTVSHNFNTRNILVAVYDNQNNQILPSNVNTSNLDQVVITLAGSLSGTVVVAKGGHIISGSAYDSDRLGGNLYSTYATTGSNSLIGNQEITGSLNVSGGITGSVSYTNLTDLPTLISGSTQITDSSNLVSGSTQITDGSGLLSSSNEDFSTFSSSVDTRLDSQESFSSSFDTAINLDSTNVTVLGNLTVQGTTTTIDSTTLNVGDNIIELNYGGSATEGGLYVKDATGGSTVSGSLLWDSATDRWIAGISGSELNILLAGGDSVISSSAQIVDSLPSGVVSGSSQVTELLPSGVISGSGNLVSGELVYGTGGSSVSSSNLVYLDTANERVGIKTTSPQYPFHYVQDTGNALAVYEKTGGAAIFYEAQDTRGALGTVGVHPLLFAINSGEVARINTSGVYEGDVSGSITGSFTGSFVGDGSGLTGIQVDQVASVTASFSEQSTINVSHNFGTYNVIVSTYDSNYNQLIPQTVSLTDTNTVQVVLSSAHSGHVVVAKGGHILDTSELTSYRESVSGASFYNITHSLDEEYPFVQAWNTSNNTQEQPLDIESVNANVISVSFSANFTGKIIVKK